MLMASVCADAIQAWLTPSSLPSVYKCRILYNPKTLAVIHICSIRQGTRRLLVVAVILVAMLNEIFAGETVWRLLSLFMPFGLVRSRRAAH
jgi:hypothetical protein